MCIPCTVAMGCIAVHSILHHEPGADGVYFHKAEGRAVTDGHSHSGDKQSER